MQTISITGGIKMPRSVVFHDIIGEGAFPPGHANQAAVSATVGSAVAGTAATNSSPYGYAQAQADAIVANINALRADVLTLIAAHNQIRADLVQLGLIKGSA